MNIFKPSGGKILSFKHACLASAALGTIAVAAPSVAIAQDDEADLSRDVIVVTARNREENLQDVPLAITAFDEEALRRKSITNLSDVARFTSGFSFEDFSGGFAVPVIRGQATTRVTSLEGNVSTFFDGIYIPRSWAIDVGTSNLNRVEVVKGPQSARYGRNAFAGAVNYVPFTAQSGEDNIIAEVTGTLGSDERYDVGFKANIPFGDWGGIAGSWNISEFDGSWGNAHPFVGLDLEPGTNGNVGGWDNTSYSASLLLTPIDRLTLEASYFSFVTQNESRPVRYLAEAIGDLNCGNPRFGNNPLICGELPGIAGDDVIVDPRAYGVQSDTDFIRARAAFEIVDGLELSYLFGKVEGDVDIAPSGEPDPINCGTLVGPPFLPALCNFQQAPLGGIDYDSHEVRVTFDDGGPIRAAVGGFFSNGVDDFQFNSLNLAPITDPNNVTPVPDEPVPSFNFATGPLNIPLTIESTETDVVSVFGELYWTSPDDRLRAGGEVRYSETEITTDDLRRSLTFNETFKVVTPRISVEYDLTDETLAYVTAARGAKAGGFNATAIAPANQVFDEEFNWTYELGAKNTFMDGRLFLNAAVFYTDWTNVQINSPDPDAMNPNAVNITLNLGDARVFGVELDARFRATDNLSFDATFSHADAKYKDGTVDARFSRNTNPPGVPGNQPCDDVVCNSNGDVGGNDVERTPPTQISLGAQWEGLLPSWGGSYYVRTDGSWQSEFFATPANVGTIPDRFLVNASAGLEFDNVELTVWARNLLDENYISSAFSVILPATAGGNTYGEFFGQRRTYGATLTFRY